MPLPLVTVTASLNFGDGDAPEIAILRFTPSAVDASGGDVLLPSYFDAEIIDGAASVDVYPTAAGRGITYLVQAILAFPEGAQYPDRQTHTLASRLQIPDEAGPFTLAELLNLEALPPISETTLQQMTTLRDETQAIATQFGDVAGAVTAAEDAQDAAELAAQQSAASAPWNYPTLTGAGSLQADTTAWADGTILQVRGLVEFVADSTETSPDRVTDGGIKLRVEKPLLWPEMFGAVGDGVADDLLAFQKMANSAYRMGGAEIVLQKPQYRLGSFEPTDLAKSLMRNNVATSKMWYLPYNTHIRSACGFTELLLDGGSSSPFGWGTSTNILQVGDEEFDTEVVYVNRAAKTIEVDDASTFAVGMRTQLFRLGGDYSAGIPRTPSRERAPCQLLTISAINGNYITFAEPFSHAFETRGDLRLARQANGGGYPENISFDGVKFSLSPGGTSAYVLFSRAYKGNFGAVRFGKGVGFSWGMSEGFTARSIETEHHGSIESVSNWHIGRYIGEGHAGAGPSGALLLNDNARDWRIDQFVARNYPNSGLWAIFGVDGSFGSMTVDGCCYDANVNHENAFIYGMSGAVVFGMPNAGYYGTKAVAESAAYLRKNLGPNRVSVERLNVLGPHNRVAVRMGDADVKIGHAVIEHNPDAGSAVFAIGDTGDWLADDVFFPGAVNSTLIVDRCDITTTDGSDLSDVQILNANAGYGALMGEPVARVAVETATTDTTITVDDARGFYPYAAAPFIRDPSSGGNRGWARGISGVSGNVLTLASGTVDRVLPVGTRLWTLSPRKPNAKTVRIRNITVNGKPRADVILEARQWVQVPAGGTATLTIAAPRGRSILKVRTSGQGEQQQPFWEQEFLVCNEVGARFSAVRGSGVGSGSFAAPKATGCSDPSSDNKVTITLTAAAAGARTVVEVIWGPA